MKRFILCFVAVLAAITMYGVPAYPGWQTKTLADGTTIEVRQVGDEFCSYWASKDGKLVLEQADGTFVKSEKALHSSCRTHPSSTYASSVSISVHWSYPMSSRTYPAYRGRAHSPRRSYAALHKAARSQNCYSPARTIGTTEINPPHSSHSVFAQNDAHAHTPYPAK